MHCNIEDIYGEGIRNTTASTGIRSPEEENWKTVHTTINETISRPGQSKDHWRQWAGSNQVLNREINRMYEIPETDSDDEEAWM